MIDETATPDQRLLLHHYLTSVFQAFLDHATDNTFVTIEEPDNDQFVQYKLYQSALYGEVGSREWQAPELCRPLSADARERLAAHGFTHGGPERNYCRDDLARSAPYLADLTLALFEAGYGAIPRTPPQVSSDVAAVIRWVDEYGAPSRVPVPGDGVRRAPSPAFLGRPAPVAPAGLLVRARRTLDSNFMHIHFNRDDRERFEAAAEAASSFEALPEWARDWMLKAEEGPLRVWIEPAAPSAE